MQPAKLNSVDIRDFNCLIHFKDCDYIKLIKKI